MWIIRGMRDGDAQNFHSIVISNCLFNFSLLFCIEIHTWNGGDCAPFTDTGNLFCSQLNAISIFITMKKIVLENWARWFTSSLSCRFSDDLLSSALLHFFFGRLISFMMYSFTVSLCSVSLKCSAFQRIIPIHLLTIDSNRELSTLYDSGINFSTIRLLKPEPNDALMWKSSTMPLETTEDWRCRRCF